MLMIFNFMRPNCISLTTFTREFFSAPCMSNYFCYFGMQSKTVFFVYNVQIRGRSGKNSALHFWYTENVGISPTET